eukprot:738789_1
MAATKVGDAFTDTAHNNAPAVYPVQGVNFQNLGHVNSLTLLVKPKDGDIYVVKDIPVPPMLPSFTFSTVVGFSLMNSIKFDLNLDLFSIHQDNTTYKLSLDSKDSQYVIDEFTGEVGHECKGERPVQFPLEELEKLQNSNGRVQLSAIR